MAISMKKDTQSGFALLLTLIVVAVVLAIGLSLLNITLKQFTLSAAGRDSEIAFHAANTGLECMQYHRGVPSTRDDFLNGGSAPGLQCGGINPSSSTGTRTCLDSNLRCISHYTYQFSFESNKCIETSLYLLDTRGSSYGISNYTINEGLERISCGPGVVCTTVFSRGFNRGCSDLNSIRTVQRELTIQF